MTTETDATETQETPGKSPDPAGSPRRVHADDGGPLTRCG